MKKRIFLNIFLFTLLINLISAADVAYIYNKDYKVDQNVIDIFEELGMSVKLVKDKDVPRTNFDDFHMIFVGDELFKNEEKIPIDKKPTVIANYYHGEEFGLTDFDGVSKLASRNPLEVKKDGRIVKVYTQARYDLGSVSIPYYFLDDENKAEGMQSVARTYIGLNTNNDFGDVVSVSDAGLRLKNGKITQAKICFYGIIESDFWTPAAREMFLDCVGYVAITCNSDNECPDMNVRGPYCSDDDVYHDTEEFICQNPGTIQSECVDDVVTNKVDECGEDSTGDFGVEYCKGNDVYKKRIIEQRGCFVDECFFNENEEEKLVESCSNFCINGECVEAECLEDSSCPNDFYSEPYCSNNDLYKDFHDFSCDFGNCGELINQNKVQECGEDSTSSWENFCKSGDIYKKRTVINRGCGEEECFADTSVQEEFVEDCIDSCVDGECTDSRIHDVSLIDFTNSVDKILIEYLNGTDVLEENPKFFCDEIIKTKVKAENQGDFSEYVEMSGDLEGNNFLMNDIDGLSPGSSSFRSSLTPYISLSGLNGQYTLRVQASIPNDATPQNNIATREITIMCGECNSDSDCDEDFYSGEYCSEDDVYRDFHNFSCVQRSCEENVRPELVETCNQECIDGECVDITCYKNTDCGINGFTGNNYCSEEGIYEDFISYFCVNPGMANSYCRNETRSVFREQCEDGCLNGSCISCFSDIECGTNSYIGENYCVEDDVYRNYKEFSCLNPGTKSSMCTDDTNPRLIEECADACINGACVEIECKEDIECNDGTIYTVDKCENPGTADSYCTNTPINCAINADCGPTGFIQSEFCFADDVYKNYQESVCINPRTIDSYCNVMVEPRKVVDCGEDSIGEWGVNFCVGDNVYRSRINVDMGCSALAFCTDELNEETQLVEECADSCVRGACVIRECTTNSDCGTDFYSEPYCSEDGVYRDLNDFSCNEDYKCELENVPELVDSCIDLEGEEIVIVGRNNYLVNGLFIHLSEHGILGQTPNGFGQKSDSVSLSSGMKSNGSTSLFIKYSISDEVNEGAEVQNSSIYITFNDLDFKEAIVANNQFKETVKIVFLKDGPTNPENPGNFIIPNSAPKILINKNNYLLFQTEGPIINVNNKEVEYKVNIPQDVIDDAMQDGEFSIYITLGAEVVALNRSTGGLNTKESLSLSDIVFKTRSSRAGEICRLCFGECRSNSDCDDSSAYTIDVCELPNTPDSHCVYTPVNCVVNSDCGTNGFIGNEYCSQDDVYKDYRNSTCVNPGTTQSYCVSNTIQVQIVDCGNDSLGEWQENFCSEEDIYRSRTNIDKGCREASCFEKLTNEEEIVEECSFECENGICFEPECRIDADCNYLDNMYCSENSEVTEEGVCRNFECTTEIVEELDCGEDYCTTWQNICLEGNVYESRACYNNGCSDESCFANVADELRLKEICPAGCNNGECIEVECTKDSDCSSDFYSEEYCSEDGVKRDFHNFSCIEFECKENVTTQLVEECTQDYCEEFGLAHCVGDDVYQNRTCYESSCVVDICSLEGTNEERLVETCEYGCLNGICKGFIPINKPIDIILVLDNSGSINNVEFEDLQDAAVSLVEALEPSGNTSNFGITFFNTEGHLRLKLSDNQDEVVNSINGLIKSEGATHMQSGMLFALNELINFDDRPEAPNYMLIITDGEANRYYSSNKSFFNSSVKNVDEIINDLDNFLSNNPEQFTSGYAPRGVEAAIKTADAIDQENIGIFVLGVGITSDTYRANLREDIATSPAFYYDVNNYAELEEKLLSLIKE